MKNHFKPTEILKQFKIELEEISDVVITHAHHDHIEAVKNYSNAVIHIQKEEYNVGRKYIPDGFRVHTFDKEYVINDCIYIKKIGGHSVGSCIVEFTKNNIRYVIAGDECYSRVCLDEKIPTGSSHCLKKSQWFVNEYSKNIYKVLLCHEAGLKAGYIED